MGTSVHRQLLHGVHKDIMFAIWYVQNLLDVWITKMAIRTGEVIELNHLVNALGGPFSIPSLTLKILVAPSVAYFLYRISNRYWGKSFGIGMMMVMNVIYIAILTNNFVVFNRIVN